MAAANPEITDPEAPDEGDAQVAALQSHIAQLTQAIQAQGDRDGQLAAMVGNLQAQIGAAQPQQQPLAASDEFQRMYADIPGYIRQVAIQANREVLGPHLANQASQIRDAMLSQARAGVDGEYGEGTWDEHFAGDVAATISNLPLEMQSSRQHLEAAVAAVLGRQYLTNEGAKKLEDRRSKARKAKEDAMDMLPSGRARPSSRGDQLNDQERGFLDSLKRSGIDYDESSYKLAKAGGSTIDEWEAAHAKPAGKGK